MRQSILAICVCSLSLGCSVTVGVGNTEDSIEWESWLGELAHFEELTGIRAELVHVDDAFELLGRPGKPALDVYVSAQPAQMLALHDLGYVQELPFDTADLVATYGQGAVRLGSNSDGEHLMVPVGGTVKSLIWARSDTFTPVSEGGLGKSVPATWEEMMTLTADLADDDGPPWAMLFGEADPYWAAWPATDWIEDILLHTCGPTVYGEIFSHERPFDDPCMADAWQTFGTIARVEGYVAGSEAEMMGRWFNDLGGLSRPTVSNAWAAEQSPEYAAAWPSPPTAARLHHQASFFAYIVGGPFWISDDPDYTFLDQLTWFPTPAPAGSAYSEGAVIAGDMASIVSKSRSAEAFTRFLMSDEYGKSGVDTGVIIPNLAFDDYGDDNALSGALAPVYHAAMTSDAATFDGSDVLPVEVEKAFRDGLVVYLTEGAPDLDAILDGIEASWGP